MESLAFALSAQHERHSFIGDLGSSSRTQCFSWLSVRGFLFSGGDETSRRRSDVPFIGSCRRHAVPIRPSASHPVYRWSSGARGWLAVFYREHIRERDEQGEPNVGLVVLLVNVHAYLLGAIALALPNWIAVGTTVAAVLLLTGRERLHELARRIEMKRSLRRVNF